MFGWRGKKEHVAAPAGMPSIHLSESGRDRCDLPIRDTSETRRAARTDLLAGIGNATETNLTLGRILRDAFGLVHEMAAFSADFDATAEKTRARADQFVESVSNLQSQSDVIEDRLVGATEALASAHTRSKSAQTSVEDLTTSINDIERVLKMIASISNQINLLALNATIEAARAGEAGAGFRVVAGEVKDLSQQTQRATNEIVASVKRIRDRAAINTVAVKEFDSTIESIGDIFGAVRAAVLAQGDQTRGIGFGSEELAALAQKVRLSAGRMQELGGTVKSMADVAEDAASVARHAFATLTDRAAVVLRHGEGDGDERGSRWPVVLAARVTIATSTFNVRVIDLSTDGLKIETGPDFPSVGLGDALLIDIDGIGATQIRLLTPITSGFETVLVDPSEVVIERIRTKAERLRVLYLPYIERVRMIARDVSVIVENALAADAFSLDALFDTHYRRDGMTEPAQYMNAAVAPLESCLRTFLEDALLASPAPDFCFLQDRNGFAAIHNSRYSFPARAGDAIWNLRHSRTRRIFDDRVGMAASRNLKPFCVHSYARDMGDAVEVRMEFDAPVFIKGRHWGTVRMAYKLFDAEPRDTSTRIA